jgi:hypothetical protein
MSAYRSMTPPRSRDACASGLARYAETTDDAMLFADQLLRSVG